MIIFLHCNKIVDYLKIFRLFHLIDDLRETVIYPLKDFESYSNLTSNSISNLLQNRSKLVQPPKGVLLYGVSEKILTII